jgi:large subunit ribosomal protein L7/L12
VARKTIRYRWLLLIQVAIGLVAPALWRLVWASSHSVWSGYGAVYAVTAAAVAGVAIAPRVRRVHRRGDTLRGILLRRRQAAQARVDSADKLHAQAPVGAAVFALASFPAAILALVAAPRAGGLDLPPAADARLQLLCVAAVVLAAVIGVDCWYGFGISVRALATDRFTSAAVGFTVALAAASPLMIFYHVDSRAAWLAVAVTQWSWCFAGFFLCAVVSERRNRRLYRLADAALDASTGWPDGPGIDAHYDLILQSAGDRKIQVIKKIRTVTTMGMKEAKDLVDNAPGLVLHRVTSERAERARNLLEGVGATVTVSGDPAIENAMITKDLG